MGVSQGWALACGDLGQSEVLGIPECQWAIEEGTLLTDLKIVEQFHSTLRAAGSVAQRLLQHVALPAPAPFIQPVLPPSQSGRRELHGHGQAKAEAL